MTKVFPVYCPSPPPLQQQPVYYVYQQPNPATQAPPPMYYPAPSYVYYAQPPADPYNPIQETQPINPSVLPQAPSNELQVPQGQTQDNNKEAAKTPEKEKEPEESLGWKICNIIIVKLIEICVCLLLLIKLICECIVACLMLFQKQLNNKNRRTRKRIALHGAGLKRKKRKKL